MKGYIGEAGREQGKLITPLDEIQTAQKSYKQAESQTRGQEGDLTNLMTKTGIYRLVDRRRLKNTVFMDVAPCGSC
jgi:ATP sulfurylase